jgi:hypothetical protein
VVGFAKYSVQLSVWNYGHLAGSHGNYTVGQSLQHISVEVAEISGQMKRCNLSGPVFEHLLPAAHSLQNNRTEINRNLRRNNRLCRSKRLDARNRPDKEVLLLLGQLVGPCQSLQQKFHHSCKTEPYKDVPCRLVPVRTVSGTWLLVICGLLSELRLAKGPARGYPSGHFDAMWLFNDKFERVLAKFEEIKGWKQ